MQKTLIGAACTAILIAASGAAQAVSVPGQGTWESTLQGRHLDGNFANGFEAYYDTALNITWLADANYAGTAMPWFTADAWAANLNPYGSGITGWRLPTAVDVGNNGCAGSNYYQGVDCGYNITTHSEMSYMFYVTLGNLGFYSTSGAYQNFGVSSLSNTGPFSNLLEAEYWSATGWGSGYAFVFTFDGYQGVDVKDYYSYSHYAWAVHAGDVGTAMPSAVPVPAAAWLFGSGVLSLVGVARRKAA